MPSDESPTTIDANTGLAAERTLLAWIRTGLALMGFGFVVLRFGLFLREMAAVEHLPPRESTGVSFWIGGALVVLGVLVNLLGGVRHVRLIRRLASRQPYQAQPYSPAVLLAVVLALLGIAMAVHFALTGG